MKKKSEKSEKLRVAVTGVSGYLGGLILEKLEADDRISSILGIDVNPPVGSHQKLTFEKADIRDKATAELIRDCDVLVHLAFIVETMHDRRLMYDINVNGSRNMIFACERYPVKKLVIASSVAAYGSQGDRVVNEKSPLLADSTSFYGHTKRIVEEILDVFEARNPEIQVARIRPSIFVGPKCDTWAAESLTLPFFLDTPEGLSFPLVHEDDVAEGFKLSILNGGKGVFLLAMPEPLPSSKMAALSGKKCLVMKKERWEMMVNALFRLRMTKMSKDWMSLAFGNSFNYRTDETQKTLRWKPRYSAEDAFNGLLENSRKLIPAKARFSRKKDRIGGIRYGIEGRN